MNNALGSWHLFAINNMILIPKLHDEDVSTNATRKIITNNYQLCNTLSRRAKQRRTFTVGCPSYIRSGYLTENSHKLWPRCASSSLFCQLHCRVKRKLFVSQNKKKKIIFTMILMHDLMIYYQIQKYAMHPDFKIFKIIDQLIRCIIVMRF